MNHSDLEQALLLLHSGELQGDEQRRLEAALAADPELQARAAELELLQQAGHWSTETIPLPEIPELNRERILQAAPRHRHLPRLQLILAAAAMLLMGINLWQHLAPAPALDHLVIAPPRVQTQELNVMADVEEDPLISELAELDAELALLEEPLLDVLQDELLEAWAEELIQLEDTI